MAVPVTSHSIFLLCLFGIVYLTRAEINSGFSVQLTHHELPKSPYSHYYASFSQHYVNALHHSIKRAEHLISRFLSSLGRAQSIVSPAPDGGGYFMKISIGTPPFEISGFLDTGSDLIWTHCITCKKCFKQVAPLFDPKNSTTYKNATCNSKECNTVVGSGCSKSGRSCNYTVLYGDQSFSTGNVATDIVTMNSTLGIPVTFEDIIFGCAHRSQGTFSEKTSGIIGLGGGSYSLISQMGPKINGKFSYCLPPLLSRSTTSSKINFGKSAVVSGKGVAVIPLVTNDIKTYYSLTLEGMSVGNQRFNLFTNSSVSEGNFIIDSGTTFTHLPKDFYNKIENSIVNRIKHKRLYDPKYMGKLCYEVDGNYINAPVITAHFTTAEIRLPPMNTFLLSSKGVYCFTFEPLTIPNLGGNITGIIGNVAQTNFLVGYDLKKRTLSFKPTDCTNYGL